MRLVRYVGIFHYEMVEMDGQKWPEICDKKLTFTVYCENATGWQLGITFNLPPFGEAVEGQISRQTMTTTGGTRTGEAGPTPGESYLGIGCEIKEIFIIRREVMNQTYTTYNPQTGLWGGEKYYWDWRTYGLGYLICKHFNCPKKTNQNKNHEIKIDNTGAVTQ